MNKLKLNENKTKIMDINMYTIDIFKINDWVLDKVEHINYLGFIIHKKLKMNEHIEYMCKKIGKKIGCAKKIRIAINTYNTIIKSHFEFDPNYIIY